MAKLESSELEGDSIPSYEEHEGGYRAANFVFKKFGTKHFKEFAEADVERGTALLKELGYTVPLDVPYKVADEYETVELVGGKPVTVTIGVINEF